MARHEKKRRTSRTVRPLAKREEEARQVLDKLETRRQVNELTVKLNAMRKKK